MGWYSTPEPPDYTAAAQAQGVANKETAITSNQVNNPNVVSPQGTVTYDQPAYDPDNPYADLRPTQTITLNDVAQQIYDLQQGIGAEGLQGLYDNMDKVWNALGTDYSLQGSPQTDFNPNYTPNEYYQTEAGIDAAPGLYSTLDLQYAAPMPIADAGVRDMVTQAMYGRGTNLLEQSFAPREQRLREDLSNQGIFTGSDAYKDAWSGYGNERNQAFNDLALQSIIGGGAEMERLYNMGMGARQQSVNELLTQGQFRNQARNQMINELLASMGAKNAAVAQGYNTAAQQAGIESAGRAQALQELTAAKTLPINIVNAILGGTQVGLPQLQTYSTTGIAPPPLFQAAQNQYQASLDAYNARNAMLGNFLQAGAGIVGAGIGQGGIWAP